MVAYRTSYIVYMALRYTVAENSVAFVKECHWYMQREERAPVPHARGHTRTHLWKAAIKQICQVSFIGVRRPSVCNLIGGCESVSPYECGLTSQ